MKQDRREGSIRHAEFTNYIMHGLGLYTCSMYMHLCTGNKYAYKLKNVQNYALFVTASHYRIVSS